MLVLEPRIEGSMYIRVQNFYRKLEGLSMKIIRVLAAILIAVIVSVNFVPKAWAFCGFYVAKADSKLYNQASQVILARDGNRTILTMANDFQGDVKDFAIVVPVPVVLQKEQVNVGDPKIIERLDAFSAPRLVEYFDPDPCAPPVPYNREGGATRSASNSELIADQNESA